MLPSSRFNYTSNSSSLPSTSLFIDGCVFPATQFVACLALALPTPSGMSPLPRSFICYRGLSREDDAPMGHVTFEEGRGELVGGIIHVYPGSGLRASVSFRSSEHAAVEGVQADTMHIALAGMRYHYHH
jgi:hypothetical protein